MIPAETPEVPKPVILDDPALDPRQVFTSPELVCSVLIHYVQDAEKHASVCQGGEYRDGG